jgi:hypothetical protein
MKATKIIINTFMIECPHDGCEGHLLSNINSSYDIEPSELSFHETFYCGDCSKCVTVSKKVVNQVSYV